MAVEETFTYVIVCVGGGGGRYTADEGEKRREKNRRCRGKQRKNVDEGKKIINERREKRR